jgi:hypothetical protein
MKDLKAAAKAAVTVELETSKEYATKLLFGSGAWAMKEQRTNREVWEAGRRDQLRLKLRDPNAHERALAVKAKLDADKASEGSLTAAQIVAVDEFPVEKVKALTATEITNMKNSDQAKYDRYRLAAATHGVLPASLIDKLNTPDKLEENEVLQPIPAMVAERLNLDPTLWLSKVGLDKALVEYGNRVAQEQIAALGSQEQGS